MGAVGAIRVALGEGARITNGEIEKLEGELAVKRARCMDLEACLGRAEWELSIIL